MLWENYSRRAKVVSLEEQPGKLSWATVNNILLVGWIVTRTSDIESRQKVHSVRFSSTWDTCLAVFCTLSALTFISPTNLVDGQWLWVPILLSHRYSSRHRGANTTGETPVLSKWLDGGTSADECKETLSHFFFFFSLLTLPRDQPICRTVLLGPLSRDVNHKWESRALVQKILTVQKVWRVSPPLFSVSIFLPLWS